MARRTKGIANTPEEVLPPEALRRRWEHALHEDSLFNQRMAFFAATEGLFLVAMTTLWAEAADPALIVVAGSASALFAVFWLSVQRRQWKHITKISELLEYDAPEFCEVAYADRGAETPEDSTGAMAVWLPVGFLVLALVLTVGFVLHPKRASGEAPTAPRSAVR